MLPSIQVLTCLAVLVCGLGGGTCWSKACRRLAHGSCVGGAQPSCSTVTLCFFLECLLPHDHVLCWTGHLLTGVLSKPKAEGWLHPVLPKCKCWHLLHGWLENALFYVLNNWWAETWTVLSFRKIGITLVRVHFSLSSWQLVSTQSLLITNSGLHFAHWMDSIFKKVRTHWRQVLLQ